MKPSLHSAPYQVIETSMGPVRLREAGDGPVLVFVHGALLDGSAWQPVVDLLADRYRCVVPDWPLGAHLLPLDAGADLSLPGVARIVEDVLAALDLDGVTLVANDSGGAITQVVMAGGAARVGAVVLTSCEVDGIPPVARLVAAVGWVPGGVALAAVALRFAVARRLLLRAFASRRVPAPVDAAMHLGLRDRAIRRDAGRFLRGVRSRDLRAAARALPGFGRPVLVVWAARDRVLPASGAARLHELLPQARVELLDASRLLLMLDHPDVLAALVAEFVPTVSRHLADPSPVRPPR